MKTLGEKIKILREIHNFSQVYMADCLGIAQSSYSRLESTKFERITIEQLTKIAELFGLRPAEILEWDGFLSLTLNVKKSKNNFTTNQLL